MNKNKYINVKNFPSVLYSSYEISHMKPLSPRVCCMQEEKRNILYPNNPYKELSYRVK